MEQVGFGAGFVQGSDTANATIPFAGEHFIATLTSVADMTITSVATGAVNQTIDGYFLRCDDVAGVVGSAEISIPGKLPLEISTLHKHFS